MNPFDYATTDAPQGRRFTICADPRKVALLALLIVALGGATAVGSELAFPGSFELVLGLSAVVAGIYYLVVRTQRQAVTVGSDQLLATSAGGADAVSLAVPRTSVAGILYGSSKRLRVVVCEHGAEQTVIFNLPLPTDRLRALARDVADALGVLAEERTLAELVGRHGAVRVRVSLEAEGKEE